MWGLLCCLLWSWSVKPYRDDEYSVCVVFAVSMNNFLTWMIWFSQLPLKGVFQAFPDYFLFSKKHRKKKPRHESSSESEEDSGKINVCSIVNLQGRFFFSKLAPLVDFSCVVCHFVRCQYHVSR